ncbi:MAG TPA: DinB family protein [Terracidiphilus sp.]|nr:DinB family protein [Terracidiphilus sp.]
MSQPTPVLRDFFVAKLDREADLVRKAIEPVPEGRNDFKPHERSMELGYLAALVAGILGWIALMIERDELNLDDPANEGFRTKAMATNAELIASLETAVAKARRALEATDDEHLATPWAFRMNGNVVSQQPRSVMIADAVFSHLAHHRGQLTVYLRMAGSTVPAIYGPSADERF